jgi:hypothetical protein
MSPGPPFPCVEHKSLFAADPVTISQENMTPLHTDDDQLRRLDEMVRAMCESLIVANEARHDKAAKAHYLQRLETQARRVIAELTPSIQQASDGPNNVFDLGD